MNRDDLIHEYRRGVISRAVLMRRLRATGLSVAGVMAIAAVVAPAVQAGVEAQHNETLVRI
jgi:hypothetical protein